MADDIALRDERGIAGPPWLIISHLYRETTENFWYDLLDLSVRELY